MRSQSQSQTTAENLVLSRMKWPSLYFWLSSLADMYLSFRVRVRVRVRVSVKVRVAMRGRVRVRIRIRVRVRPHILPSQEAMAIDAENVGHLMLTRKQATVLLGTQVHVYRLVHEESLATSPVEGFTNDLTSTRDVRTTVVAAEDLSLIREGQELAWSSKYYD